MLHGRYDCSRNTLARTIFFHTLTYDFTCIGFDFNFNYFCFLTFIRHIWFAAIGTYWILWKAGLFFLLGKIGSFCPPMPFATGLLATRTLGLIRFRFAPIFTGTFFSKNTILQFSYLTFFLLYCLFELYFTKNGSLMQGLPVTNFPFKL